MNVKCWWDPIKPRTKRTHTDLKDASEAWIPTKKTLYHKYGGYPRDIVTLPIVLNERELIEEQIEGFQNEQHNNADKGAEQKDQHEGKIKESDSKKEKAKETNVHNEKSKPKSGASVQTNEEKKQPKCVRLVDSDDENNKDKKPRRRTIQNPMTELLSR